MKIKNLFIGIVTLMVFVCGFSACLNGDGKFNQPLFSPAVVVFNLQTGVLLKTAYGNFVPDNASALRLAVLPDDACIYMSFDYNSEYQTNSQYPVASNIVFEEVEYNFLASEQNQETIDSYNYPLSSVELFKESISVNYNGIFFAVTNAKLDKNQKLDYYFHYNPDEEPNADGSINIYLQAQLDGTSTGTQNVSEIHALNVRELIEFAGRDTTVQESGFNLSFRYVKINLNYCSGVEDKDLIYKSAVYEGISQPFNIYVLREN
jgi:hypothetical protein